MELAEIELIYNEDEQYLRNVCVDNVIFGYHNKELKVLLQQPIPLDKWTVTGGYIKRTETIEEAAVRVAFLRTGLDNLFLQQFKAFGTPQRVIRNGLDVERIRELFNIDLPADYWIFDYFVSVGFYTLIDFSSLSVKKSKYEEKCEWWPIGELPPMMFDHEHIINEALQALRVHIAHHPIGSELLPEKFTLPEIHSLYETILGKALDSRNFSKKLTASGVIEKLDETRSIGAHRSPFLYKFNKQKYTDGLTNGFLAAF